VHPYAFVLAPPMVDDDAPSHSFNSLQHVHGGKDDPLARMPFLLKSKSLGGIPE